MPLLILIEIILFGITVQDSRGRYIQNGERNCLELMADFALKKKKGKAKPGIIQMLTQCMMQKKKKSKPMYQRQQRSRIVT